MLAAGTPTFGRRCSSGIRNYVVTVTLPRKTTFVTSLNLHYRSLATVGQLCNSLRLRRTRTLPCRPCLVTDAYGTWSVAVQDNFAKKRKKKKDNDGDESGGERSSGGSARSPCGSISGRRQAPDNRRISSLYVPGSLAQQYSSSLVPYLNFDSTFEDVSSLKQNIERRGLQAEFSKEIIDFLQEGWKKFKEVKAKDTMLQDKMFELKKKQKELTNAPKDKGDHSGQEILEEFSALLSGYGVESKKLKPLLHDLEETVIPKLLRIPNILHDSTPDGKNEIRYYFYEPPNFDTFSPKSHIDLGTASKSLVFSDVSPGAFYLSGDLALMELRIEDHFAKVFDSFDYLRHSNPDFGKGVTVEGCGYDIHDPSEVLKMIIHEADKDRVPQFLMGGCSLPSFAGFFAKRNVFKVDKFLPQKLYATGRMYRPVLRNVDRAGNYSAQCNDDREAIYNENESQNRASGIKIKNPANSSENLGMKSLSFPSNYGIFSSMQSTGVTAFVASTQEAMNEQALLTDLLAAITTAYAELGLHFRVRQLSAQELKGFEKAAMAVEMVTSTLVSSSAGDEDANSVDINCKDPTKFEENSDLTSKRVLITSSRKQKVQGRTYIEVGRISLIGDYISKRLLMLYAKEKGESDNAENKSKKESRDSEKASGMKHLYPIPTLGFLNVMYAQVVDISALIAIIMENTQTEQGTYSVPSVLREWTAGI